MDTQPDSGVNQSHYVDPEAAAQHLVEEARSKRVSEPQAARELFQQAYMVCPRFPGLCLELGELMAEMNDPQAAAVTLSQVPAVKRDLWFYLLLARCYSEQQKHQLALAQLRVALATCNSNEVLLEIGRTLYSMTDYAGALEYFERYYLYIADDPDLAEQQAQALNLMGVCHCYLDEVATAVSYFDQSLDLDVTLNAMHNKIMAVRRLGGIAAEIRALEIEFFQIPGVLEAYEAEFDWGTWRV